MRVAEGDCYMGCKARVYLQRPSEKVATYLGGLDVDPRPVRNGHVKFTYNGVIEVGRVDLIAPDDWERTGTIPTIHVIQSPGE